MVEFSYIACGKDVDVDGGDGAGCGFQFVEEAEDKAGSPMRRCAMRVTLTPDRAFWSRRLVSFSRSKKYSFPQYPLKTNGLSIL